MFLYVLPGFAEKTCLAVLSGRASGKRQREKTGGWPCPWGQHHHHHRHHHLCHKHHHHYNSYHITDIPLSLPSSIHERYQISTTSADGSSVLQSARTSLRRDLGGWKSRSWERWAWTNPVTWWWCDHDDGDSSVRTQFSSDLSSVRTSVQFGPPRCQQLEVAPWASFRFKLLGR